MYSYNKGKQPKQINHKLLNFLWTSETAILNIVESKRFAENWDQPSAIEFQSIKTFHNLANPSNCNVSFVTAQLQPKNEVGVTA